MDQIHDIICRFNSNTEEEEEAQIKQAILDWIGEDEGEEGIMSHAIDAEDWDRNQLRAELRDIL